MALLPTSPGLTEQEQLMSIAVSSAIVMADWSSMTLQTILQPWQASAASLCTALHCAALHHLQMWKYRERTLAGADPRRGAQLLSMLLVRVSRAAF